MDGNTRRTRFEARVGLERDFLTKVNAVFGKSVPLAGMTRDAIESWRDRALERHGNIDVMAIAQILTEASARAELLADNSKDVFEPDYRPQPNSLDELRNLLEDTLMRASI
ncbi:hypothetical protein ACETIH_21800 [Microvirga arabica]|uniref:Uncharacterized protein n=1 Tax=Microvirga arabica TaxID=1128671 RepID=A0ABV6YDT5_9HYPH